MNYLLKSDQKLNLKFAELGPIDYLKEVTGEKLIAFVRTDSFRINAVQDTVNFIYEDNGSLRIVNEIGNFGVRASAIGHELFHTQNINGHHQKGKADRNYSADTLGTVYNNAFLFFVQLEKSDEFKVCIDIIKKKKGKSSRDYLITDSIYSKTRELDNIRNKYNQIQKLINKKGE